MTSSSQRVAKNATFLMVSQIVTWALTLLLMVFQPRYLKPEGIGKLHLAESIWQIAVVFVIFGTDILLTKEIARAPERKNDLLSTTVFLRIPLYLLGFGAVAGLMALRGYENDTILVIAVIGLGQFVWQFALAFRVTLEGL